MKIDYDPFHGTREPRREVSRESDLTMAFIQACRQRANPEFAKCLRAWVDWRVKNRLAVDPWDDEARAPSQEFRQILKKAFDEQIKNAKPAAKSVKSAAAKKRR